MTVDLDAIKRTVADAKVSLRKCDVTDGVLTVEVYRKPGRVSRMRATVADYEDFDALTEAVDDWLSGR